MRIILDRFTFPGATQAEMSDIIGERVEMNPGERITVVAPSGRGKTTLIMSLYGCRNDTGGNITLDGRDTRAFTADDWAEMRRQRLGIVFQDLRLFTSLTARENIRVKADLTGAVAADAIEEMAEALGLTAALDRPCAELSLGEQQRVAIVRALTQPCDWLLLDEPFSHLDDVTTAAAVSLIGHYCDRHGGGLVITSLTATMPLDTRRMLRL